MKPSTYPAALACLALLLFSGCGSAPDDSAKEQTGTRPEQASVAFEKKYEPLPEGIEWLTNDSDPVFASPEAKKGGVLHTAIGSFPLTFRVVGRIPIHRSGAPSWATRCR